jgi:ubiquinone/menaquinone biosynthesis C-methylase UbiE
MKGWSRIMLMRIAGLLIRICKPYYLRVKASDDYIIIDQNQKEKAIGSSSIEGWKNPVVARLQDFAYRELIKRMYAGEPREDLKVAAEAISFTGTTDPIILEVGCGSGYYAEIIPYLLGRRVKYIGVDYSEAMIRMAKENYPERPFVIGDAMMLPFKNGSFSIVFDGVSIMHVREYEMAIAEILRVSRQWVIFHTVPVTMKVKTTMLLKKAYGKRVMEWVFNEREFLQIIEENGLAVREEMDSISYDLKGVIGETIKTKTYVCEIER